MPDRSWRFPAPSFHALISCHPEQVRSERRPSLILRRVLAQQFQKAFLHDILGICDRTGQAAANLNRDEWC
jgi:hypothetical protein